MVRRVNHAADSSQHRLLILQIWFVRLTGRVLSKWRERRGLDDRGPEEIETVKRSGKLRRLERRRYAAMTTEQRRNLSVRRRERERTRTDHLPVETQQPEQLVDNQYRSHVFTYRGQAWYALN